MSKQKTSVGEKRGLLMWNPSYQSCNHVTKTNRNYRHQNRFICRVRSMYLVAPGTLASTLNSTFIALGRHVGTQARFPVGSAWQHYTPHFPSRAVFACNFTRPITLIPVCLSYHKKRNPLRNGPRLSPQSPFRSMLLLRSIKTERVRGSWKDEIVPLFCPGGEKQKQISTGHFLFGYLGNF